MERTGSKRTDHCSKLDESLLIELAVKQNESAFMELYERHKDGLRIHLGKLIPPWDIEDISMQTFLKAFLHIDSFDTSKGEFKTWLYTIGWNTALDHLGKIKREQNNMPTTSLDTDNANNSVKGISDPVVSVDENISNREDYDKLIRHIEGLSPKYREIANLRFIQEFEYNEIAARTSLPVNTVKTRIKRAKEMLQKMMTDD